TLGANAGIVDEAIDRAELLAHGLHEGRQLFNDTEVALAEMQIALLGLADRRAQLFAFAPCHCDHVEAGRSQLLRDRKPDAAAGAGDEGVTHRSARAFRPASHPALRQSEI